MTTTQLKEIVSANTARWCRLPYKDHPNGCPNFDKKKGCPPNAPQFNTYTKPPYYLVYERFDLAVQELRMLAKHPKWSKRQARNCRYYQKGVFNRILFEATALQNTMMLHEGERLKIIETPEGAGIDLFKTCELIGINLERDYLNQRYVYKMMVVGKRK